LAFAKAELADAAKTSGLANREHMRKNKAENIIAVIVLSIAMSILLFSGNAHQEKQSFSAQQICPQFL
jgi:hypothetical protein